MGMTPAKFTQADVTRAIRAAEAEGKSVTIRLLPDGTVEFVIRPPEAQDVRPVQPVAARAVGRL
jgi:hypothetical protein